MEEKKKKYSWKKIVMTVLTIFVIAIVGAFIYANYLLGKAKPEVEGTIAIDALQEEVIVTTDGDGVPHIQAENNHDLYMAQGFVQAQNRMFQMELSRRQASGELSELIGEATVDQDKYFRALGLRRAAEKSYDLYSDEAKEVLQYFADGVNAYIEHATETNTLPVEFMFIGANPEPWTPLDSLTIGKYMAFDLGGHWERQAFNYYLLHAFSEEKAYELFPTYPTDRMHIIQEDEETALDHNVEDELSSYSLMDEGLEKVDVGESFKHAVIPNEFNGSNNWVVSGEKTENGKPLLADDPHLGLSTPSIWLQMHLESDEQNVSGVIFAGVPGIILGHNEEIAWGVTNTGPDVQQLYIEKRNPNNDHEFMFEDDWEEAKVIDEAIKVKGEETIPYEVLETRNGPIISEFAEEAAGDTLFSLRWTALDPTPELQAILEINQAKDWNQFEKALENFHAPAQNFVFASVDGTIAYKANGKIPIYDKATDALLPLPGWEDKYAWQDFIPFDELPTVINPDKGFIASANNKVVSDDYPYHISNVWAQPYRYERIHEVLESNDALTLEDMQALQMDAVNLRAKEFVPLFIDLLADEELLDKEKQALTLLDEWDYTDDIDLAQPLIFDRWMIEIENILFAGLDDEVLSLFSGSGQSVDELLRSGNRSAWVDDAGGLTDLVLDGLRITISELEDTYGKKVDKWAWGDYHQVQFKHPLGSANKWLGYIYNKKPIPVNGSAVTPLAARADEDGIVNHGASWRFVIDMTEADAGYHIVGPGQSENVKSKWYSSQLTDWVEGDFHKTSIYDIEGYELKLTNKAN